MRTFWTAALRSWPVFSLAAAYAHEWAPEQAEGVQDVTVLDYSRSSAYTKFSIQCPGCTNKDSAGADVSLVFSLQVNPADDPWTSNVVLNDWPLDITWRDSLAEDNLIVPVPDSTGGHHSLNISWIGFVGTPPPSLFKDDDVTQNVHFYAAPVNDVADPIPFSAGFTVIMRPNSQDRLVGLIPDSGSRVFDFDGLEEVSISDSPTYGYEEHDSESSSEDDTFDIGAELESLTLLENKAHDIQIQIAAKKKALASNLKQEREKLCLKHLIQKCDGIICCAKAIAQRLCDKFGISTGSSFQYAHINQQQMQELVSVDAKMNPYQPHMHHCPADAKFCHEAANLPLMLTKNASEYRFKPIDLVNPPNPLLRALQLIGAVLGLSALFVFIKRRCMSMRKRVERAADLEQRRNERAYRRAARRALMRKRWDNFRDAVNCFGRREKPRMEDYEEKRALILQDAFLEQDLDAAEKGEVMEAEIRELRYAHEIVSSLVRVGEHRYDLVTPLHDPPPPLVPLPQTPGPRSRASTYTLPSYTSESLPDYSSRVGDSDSSSSLVNGYTPSTSDEQGRRSPPVSESSSARTRYTPTSSILETSPRPSQETIRTRPSRDSRDC